MLWGSGDCMSTPAVRIALTERRANTNVINTSALTLGTLCVSDFCLMIAKICFEPATSAEWIQRQHFVTFSLKKMAVCECQDHRSPREEIDVNTKTSFKLILYSVSDRFPSLKVLAFSCQSMISTFVTAQDDAYPPARRDLQMCFP